MLWYAASSSLTRNFISLTCAHCCAPQAKLRGLDLWATSFGLVNGALSAASHLLSAWQSAAHELSRDWAAGVDNNGHVWQGQLHSDAHVSAYKERIEQVHDRCAGLGQCTSAHKRQQCSMHSAVLE